MDGPCLLKTVINIERDVMAETQERCDSGRGEDISGRQDDQYLGGDSINAL